MSLERLPDFFYLPRNCTYSVPKIIVGIREDGPFALIRGSGSDKCVQIYSDSRLPLSRAQLTTVEYIVVTFPDSRHEKLMASTVQSLD